MSLYHRAVLKAQLLKHLLRIPSDRQLALLLKSGDINRFSSDKRLVAWAGLAPGVRQSGDKTVHGRSLRRETGLSVGLWFKLLRLLGFTMKGSGNPMRDTLGERVIRRLLLLLLMRC
ncbi:hypothetical protein DRO55_04670 [Candidatus Bathyarchaeota archaeon]|nr:MAG: hypothetical protein DRO55_04670 [Candidatus Bathyarchaeota archaeon]